MKCEIISSNHRHTGGGRPATIRSLMSGLSSMNSNSNNNSTTSNNNGSSSLVEHLQQHQHQGSQNQITEDESFVHKVNLAAAFHDHISCTKAGGNLNTLMAFQLGTAVESHGRRSYHNDPTSFLFRSPAEEDKEQIRRLKEMILTQLELIQQQQEQLLKKDRQLQGLKHDREALCMRLEKMERRINFLTGKLVTVNSDSNGTEEADSMDYKDSETDSMDPFCTLMNDPTTVFSKLYSNSCQTQFLSSSSMLNPNNQIEASMNRSNIDSKLDLSCSSSSQPIGNNLIVTDEKSPRKRSVGSKEKTPMKKRSRASKSLDSEMKSNLVNVNNNKTTPLNNNIDKGRSGAKKRRVLEKQKKFDVVVNENSSAVKSSVTKINFFESEMPYEVASNRELITSQENVIDAFDEAKNDPSPIEVPSWRIHPISSCYSLEGTENLDDEVFNRRHSKLEIDERRRKRWDIQRLREQKQNEKLRSGRYYGGSYFTEKSESKKPIVEVDSFFPEPKDVQFIEVCDKLPVIAFGHAVPRLPKRDFALPWLKPVSKAKVSPKCGNS